MQNQFYDCIIYERLMRAA